ncbi:uncharacterized protein LOC125204629 [Salvia hispanica]|uniref:uncharacterized protein LOC125204629 n=1 Tax=Salvia hispanica TaxID=49212 RepID=UPI00200909A0|nr:uncharacterized protein LOC125204629 [Salvia hispanica]
MELHQLRLLIGIVITAMMQKMTSGALPKSIALNVGSKEIYQQASCFYRRYDAYVVSGYDERDPDHTPEPAHSPASKIIVEQSTVNDKYVHLRFYINNKYWHKNTRDNRIVASLNQPIEDTTDPSCTLFEPAFPSQNEVYFTHVQTGWRVIAKAEGHRRYTLYVEENSSGTNLVFVDRETLVILPEHPIAFIHGKYLKAYDVNGKRLQFGSDKATDKESLHSASMKSNGMVIISSHYFDYFWWVNTKDSNWVYGGDYTTQGSSVVQIFKPVKIDEYAIALLNPSVNKYCVRSTDNCLAATSDTITSEAIIFVDELVTERQILNLNYALRDQRIYGETPFIAGTTTLTNSAPVDLIMPVEITYIDEKSYTFSRGGGRLNAGVKHTISTTPWFISIGKVIIPGAIIINEEFEWDKADTAANEVTAVGTVSVPKNSTVTVSYVGTKGICSIPFTYTKADKSAIDGKTSFENSVRGGMYEGVSYYNFRFQVDNN